MEKNSCTPINPKKYSSYGLKKNLYKEFDNEKKFLRLENSPSLHDFSNGLSLSPSTFESFSGGEGVKRNWRKQEKTA